MFDISENTLQIERREDKGFFKTTERTITQRAVMWLGQTCNLRCFFCYFLNRIKETSHPQHAFMTLEKAKKICHTLVHHYGNNSIDIQGGEPTIYKPIYDLVRYCDEIGLKPTLITNAIVLDDIKKCQKLKDAGVRDLLVSIQGLGEVYDSNVGLKGGSARQMKGVENIYQTGIPMRFNTVLAKTSLPQLKDIVQLAIKYQVRAVNFIAFNPFEDQISAGVRSCKNVPSYSEVVSYLHEALDLLEEANIEANVRYLPFCMLEEKHRKSLYNFQQLAYDPHEWDWASFAWTGLDPQRTKDEALTPEMTLEQHTREMIAQREPIANGKIKQTAQKWLRTSPRLYGAARKVYNRLSGILEKKSSMSCEDFKAQNKDEAYRINAKLRAEVHCRYQYAKVCTHCSLKGICDGFHGDYADIFGTREAKPVILKETVDNPCYYISQQRKVMET